MSIGRLFLEESRRLLTEDYLPRIERAVEMLAEEDLWWRPNEASNSTANLLLHLAGNLRQYVVAGIGGQPDTRDRQREFDAREEAAAALLAGLRAAVEEAVVVLGKVPVERLEETVTIQGKERTVLAAIYHAVEHFGMHTGQILLQVKARTGRDLGFYRVEGGVPRRNW